MDYKTLFTFTILLLLYQNDVASTHESNDALEDVDVEENLQSKQKRIINPYALLRATYRRLNGNTNSDCFKETTHKKVRRCKRYVRSHSIDGTCNNIRRRAQGAAHTRVPRLIRHTSYIVDDMPVGFPLLKNTRLGKPPVNTKLNYYILGLHLDRSSQEVSEKVFTSISDDRKPTDEKAALLYMTFGQFIDHDFAQIEHSAGHCANPRCELYGDFKYPCFPILKSTSSNKGGNSFTRSRAACSTKGKNRHQVNDITSYLDGSGIYGSSFKKLKSLRGKHGYMAISKGNLLPITKKTQDRCRKDGCFRAGDTRANENPALAAMHTVWVRFHNYVAKNLKRYFRRWNSNTIFYTARKITIAVLQHIIYKEWLPMVADIRPYSGYKRRVDASITTEFATSAFRFGHSLIRNSFQQLDKNFKEIQPPLSLRESFFNTKPILNHGIEPILLGLMGNVSNTVDVKFAKGVMEELFIEPGKKGFQSLMARNIQRGRDHGLPSYFKLKRYYRQKVRSCHFDKSVWYNMRSVYKHGKRFRYVDPYVAGIAEKPNRNKLVGPLFEAMLAQQFEKIRDGDRFYYENPSMFTRRQLIEIQKMSMATVLCVTMKHIVSIQDNVFQAFNPTCDYRKACKFRKKMNFKVFRFPVRYI